MPKIREYRSEESAQVAIPGRRAQTADFYQGDGVASGAGMMKAADALMDAAQRDEVSDVNVALAKARAEWTVKMQEQADQNPAGDPKFAETFTQQFNDSIQSIGEKLSTRGGRDAFKRGSAELTSHFTQAAGLYQIKAAGVRAKENYLAALDNNRNTLLRDPTQFDSVMNETQAALADPNGPYARMPPAEREKLARQTNVDLAKSAVQGIIDADPRAGLQQIENGKWAEWLDADNTTQLKAHAKQAIRAEEVDVERRERAREKAEDAEREKTKSDFIARLQDDSTGLTAKDILNSNLKASEKEHYLTLMERRANDGRKAVKTDPATFRDLFTRIGLPEGDRRRISNEQELSQAFIDEKLSFEDLSRLRKEFTDYRTPDGEKLTKRKSDFLKGVGPSINKSNPLMGKIDASGYRQEYEFGVFVDNEIERMRTEGKNPYDLFNPSKPDYLGKPEVLTSFQKSMQQSIDDFSAQLRGQPSIPAPNDPKARKPGETPQQYLDRMKGGK